MNKKQQFEELFKSSKTKLYSVAYSLCLNRHDAEDILQDAYLKAWKKFDEYDQDKKFINWMTTIVRNTGIDLKRSSSKKPVIFSIDSKIKSLSGDKYQGVAFDIEDSTANLFVKTEKEDFIKKVHKLINSLPTDLQCVMNPLLEGNSYEEIASITDLKITTVRARVHRAKKYIRNNFDADHFNQNFFV